MAKQKSGVNKSQAIRDFVEKNPTTTVKDVVTALAAQGIKVSPNLVYVVKTKGNVKKRKQRREQAVETSKAAGIANPVELILEVRRLAEKAGGLRNLKKLVDVLVG